MTAQPETLAVVGDLILARLLPAKDGSETLTKVKKDLEALVGHLWVGVTWSEHFDEALGRLESGGLACRVKKGRSSSKTGRCSLTPEGRRRACEFLGIEAPPPKTTWGAIKKTFLLAKALELPVPSGERLKRISTDSGLRAALLKAHYELPVPDYPSLAQATDAVAWKLIGFDSDKPFSKEAVLCAVFNRELGDQRPGKSVESLKLVVARRIAARNTKPAELREAPLRGWIERVSSAAAPPPTPTTSTAPALPPRPAAPAPHEPLSDGVSFALRSFAARVLSAARSSPTGRFGDAKVFINHVWRALQFEPEFRDLGLDGFKQRLTEAIQTRLLDLGRADLVEAMDPDDVRDSETRHLGATFHFIRI